MIHKLARTVFLFFLFQEQNNSNSNNNSNNGLVGIMDSSDFEANSRDRTRLLHTSPSSRQRTIPEDNYRVHRVSMSMPTLTAVLSIVQAQGGGTHLAHSPSPLNGFSADNTTVLKL